MTHWAIHWLTSHGYAAVFALLTLGLVGVPVPDEFVLSSAGVLVSKGTMRLLPVIGWASLGTWVGLTLSYAVGRTAGASILHRLERSGHASAEKAHRVLTWFQGTGRWALFFGYFVPGVKHILAIAAGSTGYPPLDFVRFAYSGAVVWSAAYVLIGYFLGEEWARASAHAHHAIRVAVLVAAAAALLWYLLQRRQALRREPDAPA